jgi:hypothetical protein
MFMRRRLIATLVIALILSLAGADVLAAKKSRGGRKPSRAAAKKERRGKVAKRERGRKEVARRGRRGRVRDRIASRGRRRRREARYQPVNRQYEAQDSDAPVTPRPAASGISAERATEIQEALIKLGYLEGPASGQYDEKTVEAMKLFQTANKIPATGLPSAHALKRLGVSKRSSDGYAVPVKSVSVGEKKPQ